MLGLGETEAELLACFREVRQAGVHILTLGQYLRPSSYHLPVRRYYTQEEFDHLRVQALEMGFLYVAAGPLVRSSYRAAEFFAQAQIEAQKTSTFRQS